jgi:hypothetical protein
VWRRNISIRRRCIINNINYGEGKYKIYLKSIQIGNDLLVIITGGDEHIGGVSLIEANLLSSIKKTNHKDDVVSNIVAPIIYEKLHKDTLVVCGIHLDNASKNDIEILINNAKICVNNFIKRNHDK